MRKLQMVSKSAVKKTIKEFIELTVKHEAQTNDVKKLLKTLSKDIISTINEMSE